MRGMAGPVGDTEVGGWGTPAGGGNVNSRKSPPVWISAPAAAAAAARAAGGAGGGGGAGFEGRRGGGGGAEPGCEAGWAGERGRRARVRAVGPEAVTVCAPAAGAGCRAADA